MADDAVRLGIHELIAAYADCIDDDRLREGAGFFLGDCPFLAMLVARVTTLRRVLIFEAPRYRHLVGPTRILSLDGKVAETRSNFFIARIMHTGETSLFATGRYLDRIDVSQARYRFIE